MTGGLFSFRGKSSARTDFALGFAMAAVSYALIENPCRNALRHWEYRDNAPPPLDSSVTDAPEPVVAR